MKNLDHPKGQALLAPQANSLGAIEVTRSLGEPGYQVHAASTRPDALGYSTSFATFFHTSPAYPSIDYVPWLGQLLLQHQIQAITPSKEFLLTTRWDFEEFSPQMDISQDPGIVYGCLSKVDVFDEFLKSDDAQVRMYLPKTRSINSIEELSALDVTDWKVPFFINGDAIYNRRGDNALAIKTNPIDALHGKATEALQRFEKILLQDFVPGAKTRINLLLQDGHPLAESKVLAAYENPHTGGLTSLRHSWWHQFAFIKLNAHSWTALNLDNLAGLNFPAILLNHFFNQNIPLVTTRLSKSITVRHAFPADFGYLLSKLRDPSVNLGVKLKSMFGFLFYFFHLGISSDLNYPGDRKLVLFKAKAFFPSCFDHSLTSFNLFACRQNQC